MATASDHRSLPDTTLNLYLYPLAAWGVGLAALWFSGYGAFAVPLIYLVGLWQTGLTIVWGTRMLRRYEAGEFTRPEADAGVLSVARILAGSSMLPAIVFFAEDPLEPSTWGVSISIILVAALVYVASPWVVKLSNRWTHTLVLAVAAFSLPLNTTGAVSLAAAIGWFDRFLS